MSLKRILIVGGGTAGWMTACFFARRWVKKNIQITLLESKDIGTIGVGEGSTPALKNFFEILDIPEKEWMRKCNATYKNGITFRGWSSRPGYESYFHPFFSQLDHLNGGKFERNTLLRRNGYPVEAHPDQFFLTTRLAREKRSPIAPKHFPFDVNYSYHFDSTLMGQFLKEKAIEFGAKHKTATVKAVNTDTETGNISSILTDTGENIESDFFVDCTGFRSILMQGSLNVPFVDFDRTLLNNAAIALPSPMENDIPSETVSTALSNGWAWKIPLKNRFGNGYVYSRNHITTDKAEIELRRHLNMLGDDVEARHLQMRLGCLKKNWEKNCIAIGLSQGFIEPLEATALHSVTKSVIDFVDAFSSGGFTSLNQDAYNAIVWNDFQRIKDYIRLHYLSNTRTDTTYWQDARTQEDLSESLQRILHYWSSGSNLGEEINKQNIGEYYHSQSWHCMLAGVGVLPDLNQCKRIEPVNSAPMVEIHEFIRRCSLNFIDHKTVLSDT